MRFERCAVDSLGLKIRRHTVCHRAIDATLQVVFNHEIGLVDMDGETFFGQKRVTP